MRFLRFHDESAACGHKDKNKPQCISEVIIT